MVASSPVDAGAGPSRPHSATHRAAARAQPAVETSAAVAERPRGLQLALARRRSRARCARRRSRALRLVGRAEQPTAAPAGGADARRRRPAQRSAAPTGGVERRRRGGAARDNGRRARGGAAARAGGALGRHRVCGGLGPRSDARPSAVHHQGADARPRARGAAQAAGSGALGGRGGRLPGGGGQGRRAPHIARRSPRRAGEARRGAARAPHVARRAAPRDAALGEMQRALELALEAADVERRSSQGAAARRYAEGIDFALSVERSAEGEW